MQHESNENFSELIEEYQDESPRVSWRPVGLS